MHPSVTVFLCRLSAVLVGSVFVFSGLVKAIDPASGSYKITEYLNAFGLGQLQGLSLAASFSLCAAEFTLGVCLLLGVYRRYATFLALSFMAMMTLLTLYLALFDPVADCGCFGDALILTNWQTFGKNIVLLAATLFLFIYNRKMYSLYTYKVYWFVALFPYLACLVFAGRNYRHLPIVDFRPYKVGANIPALMSVPEGAAADEYLYAFVYEKEGVRDTFSLDNLPPDGNGWTFIESQTKLIRQGYVPPIATFNLYDSEDEDVTDRVLNDPAGVFLLVSPRLENADGDCTDMVNNASDYAVANGLSFYGLTGSSSETIAHWNDYTGADYPFLKADETVLKTIVRSNPGLLLLKQGTILAKWHYTDIPGEEVLSETVGSLLQGNKPAGDRRYPATGLLLFAIPLLLVWIYDYFYYRRSLL
ncbi:hypothetical protein Barb4_04618 [Bacteroidales bacterium Barb4]|nr:hypothetical protein Barb4_04618 [Bacteroidales bacterium Barb4]